MYHFIFLLAMHVISRCSTCQHLILSVFITSAILICVCNVSPCTVFFISLVTNDVDQILMCSLVYHLSFMKCFVKFKYFVHFKGVHFVFAVICRSYLFIQNMGIAHIVSQYKVFFFLFYNGIFCE